MWLDYVLNKNPDFFSEIFSQEDALKIFETLQTNDPIVLKRIEFEIGLGGESGEYIDHSLTKEPLINQMLNVFFEDYGLEEQPKEIRVKFQKLYKCIINLNNFLNDDDISSFLKYLPEVKSANLQKYKQINSDYINEIEYQLISKKGMRKQRHKGNDFTGGDLGAYKIYMYKVVLFYEELTMNTFKFDVYVDKNLKKATPLNKSSSFAYEFHLLANRMRARLQLREYDGAQFRTVCASVVKTIRDNCQR